METTTHDTLTEADQQAVTALAEAATLADGTVPLNEQAHRGLRGEVPARHLVTRSRERVAGYAQLDPADGSAQLVVAPDMRGQGLGASLAHDLGTTAGDQGIADLLWWSFGTLPAARRLAAHLGLSPRRTLLRMAMDAQLAPATPDPLPGVEVGTATEGDIDAIVAVNALAFADHPEQGRMSAADVRDKMAANWYDPQGFFVARRDGRLVGFHWTKTTRQPQGLLGEVYVIGVHPDESGRGLGRHLLTHGLAYLAGRGVGEIELYVEGDNARVVAMYERAGFHEAARDTQWGR